MGNKSICKILSILLVTVMLVTYLPIMAMAASATGTASGTQGYNYIRVNLSGTSVFSANTEIVEDSSNWILNVSGGSQTITKVVRSGDQSIRITLSAPINEGESFTLNAIDEVFAEGTSKFESPLSVVITVPYPAEGTAVATAGTKDILVTLTKGGFSSMNVEQRHNWTLGGDSASENPIVKAEYIDRDNAKITLTNNIEASDNLTITANTIVFVPSKPQNIPRWKMPWRRLGTYLRPRLKS